MPNRLRNILQGIGWRGTLRLLIYPFTTLVTTPIRLLQVLRACRVVFGPHQDEYVHFNPIMAFISLYYWTAAVNLQRFGRRGSSPYLGTGDYKLSQWYHYTLLSLYAYWKAPTLSLLVGMFGWWLSHLIWITVSSPGWVLVVMILAVINTTFYMNTFSHQNYNALGWLFFSVGLYAIITGSWMLAVFAWMAASFTSFTVVFLAAILSAILSLVSGNLLPGLAILPAVIKLASHLGPAISSSNLKNNLLVTIRGLGLSGRGVKYRRTNAKRSGLIDFYFLALYLQFALIFVALTGTLPILFLVSTLLFVANQRFARFADLQSICMLQLSVATALIMQYPLVPLLFSYWLLVSPIPMAFEVSALDIVPKREPFHLRPLLDAMSVFLSPVQSGERVLMAFGNPDGVYERVFDGYRNLIELPLYVASTRGIHLMPDWWAVFQTNYKGAPEFWGRDIETVHKHVDTWVANYVIIYQDAGTKLEDKWEEGGFEIANQFSWGDFGQELSVLHKRKPIAWWLLKSPPRPMNGSNGAVSI